MIESVAQSDSAVMQVANVVQMPSGVETLRVVSSAPASGFVDPTYGGVKPQGLLQWSPRRTERSRVGDDHRDSQRVHRRHELPGVVVLA